MECRDRIVYSGTFLAEMENLEEIAIPDTIGYVKNKIPLRQHCLICY